MKEIKLVHTRPAIVDQIVSAMCNATNEIDTNPIEIACACLQMTQRAVAHIVKNSDSPASKIFNQRIMLDAIDTLKFSAIDPEDKRQVM